jgi:hypothetical protein
MATPKADRIIKLVGRLLWVCRTTRPGPPRLVRR